MLVSNEELSKMSPSERECYEAYKEMQELPDGSVILENVDMNNPEHRAIIEALELEDEFEQAAI
ncbi:hypothetical protein CQA53_05630 [Helicobacter didelphidarum]|uniref:Uncharacterized protein n=1 Tax=Helicobacter didelphidarum TaxID=2040648 RepID=A0A3D8IM99_9HELI|nr:hypothetical protein [Helicobacter didelphidarum]RDU65774.1 hypothetical protein CQA53_05630 [Helicobacter didelphidarum]